MMTATRIFLIALVALVAVGCAVSPAPQGRAPGEQWVSVWGASQTVPAPNSVVFTNQTLRLIARPTLAADRIRVRVCNTFGTQPLAIGAASVGVQADGAGIVAGSERALTFSGRPSIAIPPGALAVSDPITLETTAERSVVVSMFLPSDTGPVPVHPAAMQTSFVAAGNLVQQADATGFGTTIRTWPYLCGIEALQPAAQAIVTFGDSITDGTASTVDANRRWPNVLAARFAAAGRHIGVVNAGIAGNRILHEGLRPVFGPNALSRFDRDVLAVSGVTHVVVLIGINDIGMGSAARNPAEAVSAEEIIAGLQQIVVRGRARGLTMIGATLTPFTGAAYYSDEGETKRQAVNAWIRTSKTFDAVVDFDAAVRDPAKPAQLLGAYDSGDHLHPSDAGYKAMGEVVDLKIFQ